MGPISLRSLQPDEIGRTAAQAFCKLFFYNIFRVIPKRAAISFCGRPNAVRRVMTCRQSPGGKETGSLLGQEFELLAFADIFRDIIVIYKDG